jgi:hypothetical protein
MKDSIDERIFEAIEKKQDIVEHLLNNFDCMRCKYMHSCAARGIQAYKAGCVKNEKLKKIEID